MWEHVHRLGANGACLRHDGWRVVGLGLGHGMKEAERIGHIQAVNSSS